MREIEFRGRDSNGNWHYGMLTYANFNYGVEKAISVKTELGSILTERVDENTIGQFIGLYDVDGKRIYKGDIIKAIFGPSIHGNEVYAIGVVIFENGCFKIKVTMSRNAREHKKYTNDEILAYPIERNFIERHYVLKIISNKHDCPDYNSLDRIFK